MNPSLPRRIVPRDNSACSTEQALNIAQTESLLGRWSRYCYRTPLVAAEVASLVAPWSFRARLLVPAAQCWGAARREGSATVCAMNAPLMHLLGMTPDQMTLATGTAAGSRSAAAVALCGRLRSCWACMANGFHSALFQFHAVRACPLHCQTLTVGCPMCGIALSPTFESTALSPFACPACNAMWIRSVRTPEAEQEVAAVDRLLVQLAAERGMLSTPDDPARLFGLPHRKEWRYEVSSPATRGRAAARWCAWSPLGQHLQRVDEVQRHLPDWRPLHDQLPGQHHRICSRAATDCLQWLEDRCLCAQDSLVLRFFKLPRRSKPPWKVKLPAVALHLTMCRYGRSVSRVNNSVYTAAYRDIRWNSHQAGAPLFESAQGNAELLRWEILGYFAMCLVKLSKMTQMADHSWLDDADPAGLSLPAWIVETDTSPPTARVRPRVSMRQVERLLGRFRHRLLSASPYFRSIGALRNATRWATWSASAG